MGHNGRSCSCRAWTSKAAHTNSAVMPRHLPFFQNNWPLCFSTWWNSRCTFMCNNVHEVNSHLSTSAIANSCQSYQNVNRLESEVTDSWLFFHFYEATWLLKLVSKLLFPRTSLLLATFGAADTVFSLPQFSAMIWALEAFHATVIRETLNRHLDCVSKSCLINWIYNS